VASAPEGGADMGGSELDSWRPLGILVRAIMDGSAERKAPRPRCRIHWL
jgi:hypothetical protein